MEVGESSLRSKRVSEEDIWAKLEVSDLIDGLLVVPSDSRYSDIEIRSKDMVISSAVTSISDEKTEWCKITQNSDRCSAVLLNTSLKTILVDGVDVGREDDVIVKCGTVIIPGSGSLAVQLREETLQFVRGQFLIVNRMDSCVVAGSINYRFKVMPQPESSAQKLKVSIDADHAKCSICLNIWHDVVTVAPCLHNFCNGCFSEWLRRSQEKHSSVLCPQCRAVVQFAGRNHFLHSMEEDILQADVSLKRSEEETALLDSYASIKSNLIIQATKKRNQKRPRTPSLLDEYSDVVELQCLQCGSPRTQVGEFHCNRDTIHLQCHGCGGMMPSRSDIRVPQHCLGCNRVFCGAYWHSEGAIGSGYPAICNPDTFKAISERVISTIPFVVHEKNRHEQNITDACIRQMGKTLQDVISEWIRKFNNREIDRSRLLLNHAEMINSDTHVCNECYDKLISFLLYWYRVTMPRHLLPHDAKDREDCWYGYSCRTQHHNEGHARKKNHVCRPSRGGGR